MPLKAKAFGQLLWLVSLFLTSLCAHIRHSFQTNSPSAKGGLRLDLIHRGSPLSPYYNPSATTADRLRLAASLRRRRSRPPMHMQNGGLVTGLREAGVGYLMGLNFGTPPRKLFIEADTGSDLIWIQCNPCPHCIPQDEPLFDSSQSATYVPYPCAGELCGDDLRVHGCVRGSKQCGYFYSYVDQTMSFGFLGQDTVSLTAATGQTRNFPNTTFGCSIFDAGTFSSLGVGIAGLGTGPLSLISQLGATISYRFSHCLVPPGSNQTGSISFGEDPLASREKHAVSTPLIVKRSYYATLESVTIEGKILKVPKTNRSDTGNTVVDSGTANTFLHPDVSKGLERILAKKLAKLKRYHDPEWDYPLCYSTNDRSKLRLPGLVFRFMGGANVRVPPENVFLFNEDSHFTGFCLTIFPSEFGFQVYGMMSMTNFEVEYDLKKKLLTLAPTTCAGKK